MAPGHDLNDVLARLASGGARVVGLVADLEHVLADVREGHGSKEVRRVLLDGQEVPAVDDALQRAPSLVPALQRWVRVRPLFDRRWLDKGTPVEPWELCLAARGEQVAVHVEHRDFRTGRPVPSYPSGVLLEVDGTGRLRRWRRTPTFAEALASL